VAWEERGREGRAHEGGRARVSLCASGSRVVSVGPGPARVGMTRVGPGRVRVSGRPLEAAGLETGRTQDRAPRQGGRSQPVALRGPAAARDRTWASRAAASAVKCAAPRRRRKPRSARARPAATQRRAWSPFRQRFTRWDTPSCREKADSMTLVLCRLLRRSGCSPSRRQVRVSSRPSRRLAAASVAPESSRCWIRRRSRASARAASGADQARCRAARTRARRYCGSLSSTLRAL
jgi:hypothetical protein